MMLICSGAAFALFCSHFMWICSGPTNQLCIFSWATYWVSGSFYHVYFVYMLPVLYRPDFFLPQGRVSYHIVVFMYCLPRSLFFHNYVILYLFSGG